MENMRTPSNKHRQWKKGPMKWPPSWWSGGASWHKYVPFRIHDANNEHGRPPEDQQIGPRHETNRKSCLESAQKKSNAKNNAHAR